MILSIGMCSVCISIYLSHTKEDHCLDEKILKKIKFDNLQDYLKNRFKSYKIIQTLTEKIYWHDIQRKMFYSKKSVFLYIEVLDNNPNN